MSERTHVARDENPIVLWESNVLDQGSGCYKPKGFWYEVDGDWRRWCEAENFGTWSHIHKVELNDCNVLKIDNLTDLDGFHYEYGIRPERRWASTEIDWSAVAAKYDGLEIAPYQWERRLADDFSWYYGWDCASGVIWRPRNAKVTLIGEIKREEAA